MTCLRHRHKGPAHDYRPGDCLSRSPGLAVVVLAFQRVRAAPSDVPTAGSLEESRGIATTDGEIDNQCSLVRFLLSIDERSFEAIVSWAD